MTPDGYWADAASIGEPMATVLPAGEPAVTSWRVVRVAALVEQLAAGVGPVRGRPRIVAVDGRSASGKSTLASRLARAVPRSAVVHTDDLAWHEPLYAWGDLLADGVLRPLREGRALAYRPPQWDVRGREGVIEVPAGLDLVVIEGTGASHREHAGLVDATVWVQADFAEAERRGIARDVADGVNGGPEEARAFWHAWMAEELRFFERQRTWERADVVVHGTPDRALADDEVEIAGNATASSVGSGTPR